MPDFVCSVYIYAFYFVLKPLDAPTLAEFEKALKKFVQKNEKVLIQTKVMMLFFFYETISNCIVQNFFFF